MSLNVDRICLKETDSTNSYIRRNVADLTAPTLVRADYQTGGRGQRGNVWESERGSNLLCSLLWVPDGVLPAQQFSISEAVAMAVVSTLHDVCGLLAMVKWPNDIYVGDRKICGILIEHSVSLHCIHHTVAGIGVNLNQTAFKSDAPNPVSAVQLTQQATDIGCFLDVLERNLLALLPKAASGEGRYKLHTAFMNSLWRADGGRYPFRDAASGQPFMASIEDVELDGHLLLNDGTSLRRYAFKEVEHMI